MKSQVTILFSKWRSPKPSLIHIHTIIIVLESTSRAETRPIRNVFLDFCNPFGRMSSTFYGCKLPTIERSVFEELEQTWAIGEPTLEGAAGETFTDHHESF